MFQLTLSSVSTNPSRPELASSRSLSVHRFELRVSGPKIAKLGEANTNKTWGSHPAVVAEWSNTLSNVHTSSILRSQVQILLRVFNFNLFDSNTAENFDRC